MEATGKILEEMVSTPYPQDLRAVWELRRREQVKSRLPATSISAPKLAAIPAPEALIA
jgi:hypothetical protein